MESGVEGTMVGRVLLRALLASLELLLRKMPRRKSLTLFARCILSEELVEVKWVW